MGNRSLAMALWISILVFGLGSFVLRRTRFQAARLQDIAALRGISGLLVTLQGTTIQIACIGAAIALMGFMVTIMTGNKYDMLRAGSVAAIVLISAFPQRSAWQRCAPVTHSHVRTTRPRRNCGVRFLFLSHCLLLLLAFVLTLPATTGRAHTATPAIVHLQHQP